MKSQTKIETHIPFIEELFEPYRILIGEDYQGYRNHAYRMVQFTWHLSLSKDGVLSEDDKKKTLIAAVFHDLGIWLENTLDYLEPSVPPAVQYLKNHQLSHWEQEVKLMITEHHKLRQYADEHHHLVELFRKGDLVDFSLGLVTFGLPKSYINELKTALPNAGFHNGLLKKGGKWFLRNPFNPFPMMKW